MKKKKEVKAFAIVLIGVIALVLGVTFLKSGAVFDFHSYYYAVYSNVGGLTKLAPVMLNGYQVGSVKEIKFLQDGRLIVSFTIEEDIALSRNIVANLADDGIIGTKSIQLIPEMNTVDLTQRLVQGDTLKTSLSGGLREIIGGRLDPIASQMTKMLQSIDSTFSMINNILKNKGEVQLMDIIDNFHKTSQDMRYLTSSLHEIISETEDDIRQTASNTKEVSKQIKSIVNAVDEKELKHAITNISHFSKTMDSITNALQRGEGSMGKLLKDDRLYINIANASKEMEELMRNIKLHPKRYFSILRRKEIPYKPDLSK